MTMKKLRGGRKKNRNEAVRLKGKSSFSKELAAKLGGITRANP